MRAAFTLVELLVVVGIILVLMGLMGAAVSASRTNSKKQATQLLISKLDVIIQQQFATYASRSVVLSGSTPAGISSKSAYRSWYIRRNLISGDLPDNWADVRVLATGSSVGFGSSVTFPLTAPQRAYASFCKSANPTDAWADAECLFMIVMQGGIANCLDCGELKTADRGDLDSDGAFEFWDAWGNPIGFVLWPAGVELPAGTTFFSGSRSPQQAFPSVGSPAPSPSLGLRPLIYSSGADKTASLAAATSNIGLGIDCGNPAHATVSKLGGYLNDPLNPGDYRADNITNLDAEAAK